MLKISAVSYINARPFVYGIEHSGFLKDYSLSLDVPSVCAEKLKTNQVDIGLAPVTIIPELKNYFIIPDFCIGADGPVKTVMLYSEVPLEDIRSIYLDYQSQTSVMLVQILAKYWWKISPKWIHATDGYEENIKGDAAGLIIGDRNFFLPNKFKYEYDLSAQWKDFTGLPFVFACWISNKELDENVSNDFYKSLQFGVENIGPAVQGIMNSPVVLKNSEVIDIRRISNYLRNCINYSFDKRKEEAMGLFLKLGKKINSTL